METRKYNSDELVERIVECLLEYRDRLKHQDKQKRLERADIDKICKELVSDIKRAYEF